jgi:hypothetical protein
MRKHGKRDFKKSHLHRLRKGNIALRPLYDSTSMCKSQPYIDNTQLPVRYSGRFCNIRTVERYYDRGTQSRAGAGMISMLIVRSPSLAGAMRHTVLLWAYIIKEHLKRIHSSPQPILEATYFRQHMYLILICKFHI